MGTRRTGPISAVQGARAPRPGAATSANRRSPSAQGAKICSPSGERPPLRVVQINLNKSKPPTAELNELKFDIALIQEPNISPGSGAGTRIPQIKSPRRSFCMAAARAAVVVDDSRLDYWPIESLSTRDLAVVAITTVNRSSVIIASGYLDVTRPVVTPELEALVEHCRQARLPLVLGMDSNAHSTLWGESDTNHRGEALEKWIFEKELTLENIGTVPTFVPLNHSSSTIIDVTLVNERALELVGDWKVELEDPSLSDHRRIQFTLFAKVEEKSTRKRAYRKANWSMFTETLNKLGVEWVEELKDSDVDVLAEELAQRLVWALDKVAPLKESRIRNDKFWWNESLTLKRRILKNVYRKRLTHDRVMEKYKELKKEFSNEIKRAKRNSWKDFCTKAESARDVSRLVQIMDNPPARKMSLLHNGEILDPGRSVERLLNVHFPDGVLGGTAIDGEGLKEPTYHGIYHYITRYKVKEALESFGDYKSPGPDEIPPKALKSVGDLYTEIICTLYKLSMAQGKVPKVWRMMKVVFLPKVGKTDYAEPKSYRPITLSNFILKGLERVVQWYILENIITRPLCNQHAYTKGRSCDSALSSFVDQVEKAVFTGQYLLAISLDCSGAFDCIKFDAAERCMKTKGIPDNIICWYKHLLQGRQVTTELQGIRRQVRPARGSPQGGVLSPLVWNLIMDSYLGSQSKGPVKSIGYADDLLLYITGVNPQEMGEILQPEINKIIRWGEDNGLSFNPNKTKMVLFTNKRVYKNPIVSLGGHDLELNKSFKYLGLEISGNLSWNKHITDKVNKCKRLLYKCKGVIRRTWGLTPDKVSWLYKAIIRPKVTYGAVVWASRLTEGESKKLRSLQRLALVATTQPLRSAPTAGLEVMMGWTPLDLHAKEVGLSTYSRIQDGVNLTWDHIGARSEITGHIGRWSKELAAIIPIDYPTDKRFHKRVWWMNTVCMDKGLPTPLNIYTDASKIGGNVGYGWAAVDNEYVIAEDYNSAKDINVHTGEVLSIREALSWLKKSLINNRKVQIWCDSKGAVASLKKQTAENSFIWETLSILQDVSKDVEVHIDWIKSHNNNTGNEYADMLAHQGAEEAREISFTSPFMPISQQQIRNLIQLDIKKRWQTRWDDTEGHQVSHLFKPEVGEAKVIQKLTLMEVSKLSQIITGHGLYKRHLRHWIDVEDASCALCGEDQEYSWHLWAYCPCLAGDRDKICRKMSVGLSWEKALLKFFELPKLLELVAHNEALIGA